MDVYNSHLKQIIKANDENRLAVFVGSGISLSSNTDSFKLPLWDDLIVAMKRELQLENENDYLKVAQLYFLEFGESTYYSKIKSFFPDNIPPSELHKVIFELMPQCVITTNWDSILEDAIDEGGALYSVICSDKDLVKSTNLKKLIKMHGDFKNHNIVFKEDDYLSYTHNFPLTENYIKSILSTHTIIFIGYSYSDINLKHIMKWIQNHSDYSPPMYLTASRNNAAQTQYLKSHGINTLVLQDIAINEQENSRFDKLSNRSKQIALFLEDIQIGRFKSEGELTSREVAESIYDRIKHLERLNFILIEQIRTAFTNCGFEYTQDALPILELFKVGGVLTTNYDRNIRLIYESFISILEQKDKNILTCADTIDIINKIMGVLAKANIAGVITSQSDKGRKTYVINEQLGDLSSRVNKSLTELNFSTENSNTVQSRSINHLFWLAKNNNNKFDYLGAYQVTLEIILLCKKQKNYTQLLIAIFNANSLIFKLKYYFKYNGIDDFKHLKTFDLQEQFLQFPKIDIKQQQTLFNFLTLKSIYIQAVSNSNDLIKINNAVESIKNGGHTFNNHADKPLVEHANLLLFTVKNHLIIDDSVFKQMMRRFVDISIARQSIKDIITLNTYELYTCIQHIDEKSLISIFKIFNRKDEEPLKFELSDINENWLLNDVLTNVMDQYLEASSIYEYPETELRNIITLISYLKLNEEKTAKILKEFSRLIASKNNTINTYESINHFFATQHQLFQTNIDNELLIELMENIINKVVYRSAHGWDRFAITGNKVNNIYGYIEVNNGVYSNIKLIKKLIAELDDFDVKDKVGYCETLLYSVFKIGNNGIKNIIKTFIKSVISEYNLHTENAYIFNLWCVAAGFLDELENSMIEELEKYISRFVDGTTFIGSFYQLKDLIDYLIKEKTITSLKQSQELLHNIISNHDSRPNPSNI